MVKKLSEQIKFKSYKMPKSGYFDVIKLMNSGKIDFYIGDSIEAFYLKGLTVAMPIDKKVSYFGIQFLKHSPIKKLLDPTIKYFSSSRKCLYLLVKYFGVEFHDYYKKTMTSYYKN